MCLHLAAQHALQTPKKSDMLFVRGAQVSQKICTICQKDCSERPRVRDEQGRYFCKACLIRQRAKSMAQEHDRRQADKQTGQLHAKGEDASHEDMLDIYAIEDEKDAQGKDANELSPLPGFNPLPVDLIDTEVEQHSCPVCKRTLAADARICVGCGYDKSKGIQSSTRIEKTTRKGTRGLYCENCGYDMEGLPEPICPECGTRIDYSRDHRLLDQKKTYAVDDDYKKPLAWFAVGFVLSIFLKGIFGGLDQMILFTLLFVATVLAAWVGLWIGGRFLLGDSGTALLNLVRLAGAVALGSLVDVILPFSLFFLTPGIFVFCVVLTDVLDIELRDSFLVTFIMAIFVIPARLAAFYLFMTYF